MKNQKEKRETKTVEIPKDAIQDIWHEIKLHEKEFLACKCGNICSCKNACACDNVDALRLSNSMRSFLFDYGIN